MKSISKIIAFALGGLLMAGCQDAEQMWENPQSYAQEDAITIPGITAASVGSIDLGTVESDSVITFTLSAASLPEGFALENARVELTPKDVEGTKTVVYTSLEGAASVADLQSLVEEVYGKRPTSRAFDAHVYLNAVKDGQAVLIDAGTLVVNITPEAPYISEHYYLIGAPSEWSPTCTSMPFSHSGGDVYENPEFTVTFPVSDGETWFAVIDDKTLESGEWIDVLGAEEGNGLNGMEGKIARRTELSDDGSWKVIVDGDAKYVKMTINMMDCTYKLEKINFAEYFYEIGNESSWSTSHALYGANADGKYQGYYYLDGEFKFKPNADNWNGDYEYDGEGKIADNGGSNCPDPGAGFYQIDVDLTANTYALTKVTSISAIGDFNSWGGDVDLAYNTSTGAWEAQNVNFTTTGGVKFRMNHDWSVSWGGANGDGSNYGNLTQNNGQNLTVEAGTYDIQLFISYEGNNKVVLTKK